jgi:Flp pilus assembly protein TadD
MKLHVVALVASAATVAASPSFADAKSEAKSQVEFGINVAQRGLWREAIYRWEKATELDPTYAAAFNDLAIAYEHEGQLDKARKAYEKAVVRLLMSDTGSCSKSATNTQSRASP